MFVNDGEMLVNGVKISVGSETIIRSFEPSLWSSIWERHFGAELKQNL